MKKHNRHSLKGSNNNKGFSLIELVAAVAILLLVAIPLLQAFTTSASLTSKATKIGEATAAAQNIQETLEARSVEDFREKKTAVQSLLGVSADNITIDESGDAIIRNIYSGKNKYEAQVNFSTDSGVGYQTINGEEIAQYTDMSGSYSQGYGIKDPDEEVLNTFKLEYSNCKVMTRNRLIQIVVESKEVSGGYRVYVTVRFIYSFKYLEKLSTGNYVEKTVNNKINTNSVIKTDLSNIDDKNLVHEEKLFPDGKFISSYDEEVAAYLFYYPFLESYLTGNSTSPEKIDIYVDRDNATSNLQFNLFLVEMVPMVVSDTTGKYISADETENDVSLTGKKTYESYHLVNGVPEKRTDTTFTSQQILNTERAKYGVDIKERHNKIFKIKYVTDADGNQIPIPNIYSNVFQALDGGTRASFSYRIYRLNYAGSISIPLISMATYNRLVKTESEERFYNVEISVYEDGGIDKGKSPIYTMNASKLK